MTADMSDFRRSRWFTLVWLVPLVLVVFVAGVFLARLMRDTPALQSFLADYPGGSTLPEFAPFGFPAWLAWQHGLNAFCLLFIIRSGILGRTTRRPSAYWTRNNRGLIRTKNPPTRISIDLWLHITMDTLWVLNGVVFYVLIFSTGQWTRIIPTSWDVFPNAFSAALQYASLVWPTENDWANYNALQLLTYFGVVVVLAPLALITGFRMSPSWSRGLKKLDKVYPIEVARFMHFPIMVIFVAFTVMHVTLVLATGALRNLNHMYAVRDDQSWVGFWVFAGSLALMTTAWIAVGPLVQRSIASLTGSVSR